MSRKGQVPVEVPKEIKVSVEPSQVKMEGSKGKLAVAVPAGIKVESKESQLTVNRLNNLKQSRCNHGTVRAHLVNMVEGLTNGHKKELEIQGIGFRAQLKGKTLVMNLGLSHSVEYPVPDDVKITVPNQTTVVVEGPDIIRVGQVAAQIRAIKPAEPYKGKGIRYVGEVIRRKQGKSVTK